MTAWGNPRRLSHTASIPAGHVDRHARHEIGIARRQKTDDLGLVGRLADATQGRAVDLGLLVFRARLVPARPDALGQGAARRDRVDVDVVGPELEGELGPYNININAIA